MDSVALLREAIADAHGALERTVTGLDQGALEWAPPGTANPIGATLAHVLVSEDVMVNAILTTRGPLRMGEFGGRTGLSEPMPMPGPAWADYAAWARRLRVDQTALLDYGRAVWAASDAFLAGLAPGDLERELISRRWDADAGRSGRPSSACSAPTWTRSPARSPASRACRAAVATADPLAAPGFALARTAPARSEDEARAGRPGAAGGTGRFVHATGSGMGIGSTDEIASTMTLFLFGSISY